MQRIILTNYQSQGDIITLTAAVRGLHRYSGRFVADARTSSPDVWENNVLIALNPGPLRVRSRTCSRRSSIPRPRKAHGPSIKGAAHGDNARSGT
jgi:hypothetical protein